MPHYSPRFSAIVAGLLCAVLLSAAWADEFLDMSASMGTTLRLAGITHSPTTNPDGTGINSWIPAYEGAPANTAILSNPHMAGADAYGNVYIADKASHSILKITTDGLIHTLAGTHVAGFNGDGPALATTLQIDRPNGLFVFPDGTVYLLDPGNLRIRRVTPDGMMTTIVTNPGTDTGQTPGTGFDWYPSGRALWVSPDQQLIYFTNEYAPTPPSIIADGACVKKWTPAGGIQIICHKALGFRNPGNIAVNPVDGKLYVTDRAEEEGVPQLEGGLWRIDGPDLRTRMTGNSNAPIAADGQLATNSFIEQPRGIAFLPNGAYFLCAHKNGSIWYVDTSGVIHRYIKGKGSSDAYVLPDATHPPLTAQNYINQPRAVTLAPDGNLLAVCNDSGFVFRVNSVVPHLPSDLRPAHFGADGLRLNWSGLFGRGYLVQRTPSLVPASWQTIGTAAGNAGGVPSEFLDPAATGQTKDFYRLAPAL